MKAIIILFKFLFFLKATSAFVSFEPLYTSYHLSKEWGQVVPIDNSHNHNHGKEVMFWAQQIVKSLDYKIQQKDLLMIGHCCLLHDLIDHKYADLSVEVSSHLERFHRPHEVDLMMNVMRDMSYSKTVKNHRLVLPDWLDESPFQDVFHITREADLLSSFNLARMIEFRRARSPFLDPKKGIQECQDLFKERMDRLEEDGVFVHPSANILASSLKTVARLKLEVLPTVYLYKNLDILRIVNHISIYDLIREMESLPCLYR